MGQIMAFWFWQRPCRARPVLWLWNECKKDRQRMQMGYSGSQPGKQKEIPDKATLLRQTR
jgi:hypothetical protein